MKEYKLLYRCYGLLDAKSIQLLLQSFNIKSNAYQESAGVALGLTVGGLGSANIYVKNEDFDNAMKVITMLENGQLEMPEIEHEDQSFVDEELDQLDLAEDDDN
ncbi:MAG: hypothetical protein CVU40_02720 [Chloroflexi bacterium HGW-Chloroflexi-2]|jgi:hypothetical protein|nr:MAG: hypothetical protein CVU40_02720 [Chloroflexi bacterium HGW-Chloroflexi-2]